MILNENECINACEFSQVTYTVNSQTNWQGSQALYSWNIIGGEIIALDGVPITPTTTYSGPELNVTIQWGAAGTSGLISLEEYLPGVSCSPVEFSICLAIIEIPDVDYVINSTIQPNPNPGTPTEFCLGIELFFEGIASVSPGSNIISWKWDFQDPDPSQQQIVFSQNASHHFDTPGDYDVSLTVVNDCNCSSKIVYRIRILSEELPSIQCPNPICENGVGVYSLADPGLCGFYNWSAIDGTVIGSNTMGEVSIQWDNIGVSGFGYVVLNSLDCGYNCPVDIVLKVPVIQNEGNIKGETSVCVDESFVFSLPAWPATDYEWEIVQTSTDASFNTFNQNSHWVEVFSGAIEGNYTLNCSYINTLTLCEGNASIEVMVLPKPKISCEEKICTNWDLNCTLINIATVPAGTLWTLTKPNLSTSQLVGSTVTFLASDFTQPGKYTIIASSPGDFCNPEPFFLDVIAPPPALTSIIGESLVCPEVGYTYTAIDLIPNTIVVWSSGLITPSPNGNFSNYYGQEILVEWLFPAPGPMVFPLNAHREWEELEGCKSTAIGIPIHKLEIGGDIISTPPVTTWCEDQTYGFEMDLAVVGGMAPNPDLYNWSIESTAGQLGSITSGQGTESITIDFLHLGTNEPCTLKCEVVKCGESISFQKLFTIQSSTIITNIVVPTTTLCSNELFDIAIHWDGATPENFFIDMGDGSPSITYPFISSPTNPFIVSDCSIVNSTGGTGSLPFNIVVSVETSCNNIVSDTQNATVDVYPLPGAILTPPAPFTYCDPFFSVSVYTATTNGSSFQWYYNSGAPGSQGNAIPGATSSTYDIVYSAPLGSNDGEYYCLVTDINGCTQESNRKKLQNICGTNCEPLCQVVVDNMQTIQTSCNEAYATCSVSGLACIVDFEWSTDAEPGTYVVTGIGTLTQSPSFEFFEPGVFLIINTVECLNVNLNDPNCFVVGQEPILIPYIADFTGGILCNANNDGYEILLTDQSPIFPTALATTVYSWTVNGTPFTYPSFAAPSPGNYLIELELTGGTFACTKEVNYTIPELPIAAFEMLTTYGGNPSNPYQSCEMREIQFTNISTSAVGIATSYWDFDDDTYSYIHSLGKTYLYPGPQVIHPLLTVTDLYGCVSVDSLGLEIFENTFEENFLIQYLNAPQNLCFGELINPAITPNYVVASPLLSFQWYEQDVLLPGVNSPTLSGFPPAGSGLYWISIMDVNYCIFNNNPSPAQVAITPAPTAIIHGDPDICEGEDISLTAMTGFPASANFTYLWESTPALTLPATKTIEILNPSSLAYSITLTVTDLNTGCENVSTPFEITVHPLPPAPNIQKGTFNCQQYAIELIGSTSVSPVSYNWSNGGQNSSTTVYSGGLYRFWITDEFGCKNYHEIDVPQDPSYYFWRFPKDACLNFCWEDLLNTPRFVNGPYEISFRSWEWFHNGNSYGNNGSNSPSGPLSIASPPGIGKFSWMLENYLPCDKTIIDFRWTGEDCCEFDAQIDIVCLDAEHNSYAFTIDIPNAPCPNPSISLIITEDGGPNPPIHVDNLTAIYTFSGGGIQISGTFQEHYSASTSVEISIMINCPNESCESSYTIPLPLCGQQSAPFTPSYENLAGEDAPQNRLLLYPNPTQMVLNIQYSISPSEEEDSNERITIRCIDGMGREMYQSNQADEEGLFSLNITDYVPGMYYIQLLKNSEIIQSKRFVIVR